MKKIKKSVAVVAALLLMSMTNNVKSENIEIENLAFADPYECWDTADAFETIACGYVGCDFWLWDQVYNSCMGNPQ